jgi:radical SAM superfamily enzyme YgiQ (UPF0313 family)
VKVLLISLPSPFEAEPAMNPPLGLAYIAAVARDAGADVSVLDYNTKDYDYRYGLEYLKEIGKADVYGISAVTAQVYWLKRVIEYIRGKYKKATIVAGGPHASACPEECLKMGADYVVKGEGELVFRDFLEGKLDNRGLYYYKKGKLVGKGTALVHDLDALPLPARDLFGMHNYKRKIGVWRAAHMITLRGCPHSCVYCDKSSVSRMVRYRSIPKVVDEIESLREDGIEAFVFYDDIFTLKKSRVKEFCEAIFPYGIVWRAWSRADTLTEDVLWSMRWAGLYSLTIGIESGDDEVLKLLGKKVTRKQNRAALKLCKKMRIPVRCSLIYGNPGESKKSLKNTIKLIEETQPDEWNLAVMSPIPGSALWEDPDYYGIELDKVKIRDEDYINTNRFGNTGVGTIYCKNKDISMKQYKKNLKYFIAELERVCPRTRIQDTIQNIDMRKI